MGHVLCWKTIGAPPVRYKENMAGLRLIWVGKTQEAFLGEGVEHYRRRITPFQPLEIIEVKAAAHSGRNSAEAVTREGENILKKVHARDTVVLLDEKGSTPNTAGFASQLTRLFGQGGRSLTFIIGGAYGVADSVRKRADATVALSSMTFPHHLVRVIFLEQLYRALSINAGQGYHHE